MIRLSAFSFGYKRGTHLKFFLPIRISSKLVDILQNVDHDPSKCWRSKAKNKVKKQDGAELHHHVANGCNLKSSWPLLQRLPWHLLRPCPHRFVMISHHSTSWILNLLIEVTSKWKDYFRTAAIRFVCTKLG